MVEHAHHAVDQRLVAHVDRDEVAADIDGGRQNLAAEVLRLDSNRDDLRTLQQLARQFLADTPIGGGFDRKGGDLGGLAALEQPGASEAGC